MPSLRASIIVALGAATISTALVSTTSAQTYTPRYAGMTASSVTGCPMIAWRLAKAPDGQVHGIIWYNDLSGLSEASGTETGTSFHLTLTSVMGKGPVGTVTGQAGSGATLTGEGCANATFKVTPVISYGGTG